MGEILHFILHHIWLIFIVSVFIWIHHSLHVVWKEFVLGFFMFEHEFLFLLLDFWHLHRPKVLAQKHVMNHVFLPWRNPAEGILYIHHVFPLVSLYEFLIEVICFRKYRHNNVNRVCVILNGRHEVSTREMSVCIKTDFMLVYSLGLKPWRRKCRRRCVFLHDFKFHFTCEKKERSEFEKKKISVIFSPRDFPPLQHRPTIQVFHPSLQPLTSPRDYSRTSQWL